ncbi:uncharacterized protein LOC110843715 isoform X2 [Folsomia candida]|uniref:uncharacterized protein LOC110843715 isoform X2 n=1 Tax=Folsomia candida TaxID=158441 RepID=UPI0016051389|nr:uncharacterized protein LOC110843715 isoform X2 [Folsomia candida]
MVTSNGIRNFARIDSRSSSPPRLPTMSYTVNIPAASILIPEDTRMEIIRDFISGEVDKYDVKVKKLNELPEGERDPRLAAAVDNREAWAKVQRLMEVKVAIQAEIRSDHLR